MSDDFDQYDKGDLALTRQSPYGTEIEAMYAGATMATNLVCLMAAAKERSKSKNEAGDEVFEPKAHLWVSEKLSWYDVPEGIKVFDKQP